MSIDLKQFFEVFFDEAAEHLASMESLLLAMDVSAPQLEDLHAVFRAAHSIKGAAGTFGFADVADTTHVLETLLDRLRKQELRPTGQMLDVLLEAGDVIKAQLAVHRGSGQADPAAAADIRRRLEALAATGAGDQPSRTHPEPAVAAVAQADPGFGFFDNAPAAPSSDARVPEEAGYGFFTALPEPPSTPEEHKPRSPGRRASDDPDVEALRSGRRDTDKLAVATAGGESSSIRVGIEKVDHLINLVGELVITQAMLAQTAGAIDPVVYEKLLHGLDQLARNTRDLQESVMSIRMLPIAFVFSRFPRMVRDLAGKLNKQADLQMVGESTELDKGVIEKISDPLTHLVRNSLDHGIESPAQRSAAGKPEKGTITLRAFHLGGNIVIEVADDGAGLNREKILAKARSRGMQVHDGMADEEVWQLIFEAGFSTAEQVTDVSGRGVGMDVVKRNIQSMGGRVDIDSALGLGTRISIRLPLTLAILDGMSVAVGAEVFIVPLTFIVESVQPTAADLHTLPGRGRMVQVRNEHLPILALHELFDTRPRCADPSQGIVVIVESDGRKVALFVDELLGQHQVVIKSLDSNFRKVQGFAGATIMGDGKVALILDIAGLVRGGQLARAA